MTLENQIQEITKSVFVHLDETGASEMPVVKYHTLMKAVIWEAETRAEAIAFEFFETIEKSEPAAAVLRLMDSDYSYSESLKLSLIIFPNKDKKSLEAELSHYI